MHEIFIAARMTAMSSCRGRDAVERVGEDPEQNNEYLET